MEQQFTDFSWFLFAMLGTVIATSVTVVAILGSFRTRQKALEVLKAYAERGEEPPANVLTALQPVQPAPPPAEPIPRVGFFVVLGLGCGIMWAYLAPHPEFGLFALLFFIAATVSAALAVSNLLRALTSRKP